MANAASVVDQFKGLPMETLIGAPLKAACDSQVQLAQATADFIKQVGQLEDGKARMSEFRYKRPTYDDKGIQNGSEEVSLEVPMLAVVKVPSLGITSVDITFDMEVKSSFAEKNSTKADATATASWSGWGAKVSIQGSVSTARENTRSSDNSAKYHVQLHAEDRGLPEGLARVLDILQASISTPLPVTP